MFSGPPDPETGLRPLKSEVGPEQPIWQKINATFERSMFLLHKFPLVWVAFCNFLMHQPWRITYTRRTFDRAFKSLPITQHANIWDLYLKFAANAGGETCVRIWRRYLKVQPTHSERYIDILLAQKPPKTAEAALVLSTIIEHPEKHAATGKTTYQYWSRLCDLICEYPDVIEFSAQDHMVPSSDMNSLAVRPSILDIEKIMRAGIVRFTDQVGKLWNSLASWWVLRGELERARDVYEEALANVSTVRDFKLVFDAFAQMEEKVLAYEMEAEESDLDAVDIDLRLARFERLLQRRPILLYDVLVRQNPNQVHHWMNRTKLFTKLNDIVYCFNRAVKTVNPKRAQGPLHSLWIDFANMYEKRGDLDNARKVYERAVAVPFVAIDNLATIWCQWAEMELRAEKYQNALDVLGRATAPLSGDMSIKYNDESKSPQQRIFKSIRLWSFYVDLEESVGSVESCKAVYDRILELKIATPQIITNYASFLEEKKFYEDV